MTPFLLGIMSAREALKSPVMIGAASGLGGVIAGTIVTKKIDKYIQEMDLEFKSESLETAKLIMQDLGFYGLSLESAELLPKSFIEPGDVGEVVGLFQAYQNCWGNYASKGKPSLYNPFWYPTYASIERDLFIESGDFPLPELGTAMDPLIEAYGVLRQIALNNRVSKESRRTTGVFLYLISSLVENYYKKNESVYAIYQSYLSVTKISECLAYMVHYYDLKILGSGSAEIIRDNTDTSWVSMFRGINCSENGTVLELLDQSAFKFFDLFAKSCKDNISKSYADAVMQANKERDMLLQSVLEWYSVPVSSHFRVFRRLSSSVNENRKLIYELYLHDKTMFSLDASTDEIYKYFELNKIEMTREDWDFYDILIKFLAYEKNAKYMSSVCDVIRIMGTLDIMEIYPLFKDSIKKFKKSILDLSNETSHCARGKRGGVRRKGSIAKSIRSSGRRLPKIVEAVCQIEEITDEAISDKEIKKNLDSKLDMIVKKITDDGGDKFLLEVVDNVRKASALRVGLKDNAQESDVEDGEGLEEKLTSDAEDFASGEKNAVYNKHKVQVKEGLEQDEETEKLSMRQLLLDVTYFLLNKVVRLCGLSSKHQAIFQDAILSGHKIEDAILQVVRARQQDRETSGFFSYRYVPFSYNYIWQRSNPTKKFCSDSEAAELTKNLDPLIDLFNLNNDLDVVRKSKENCRLQMSDIDFQKFCMSNLGERKKVSDECRVIVADCALSSEVDEYILDKLDKIENEHLTSVVTMLEESGLQDDPDYIPTRKELLKKRIQKSLQEHETNRNDCGEIIWSVDSGGNLYKSKWGPFFGRPKASKQNSLEVLAKAVDEEWELNRLDNYQKDFQHGEVGDMYQEFLKLYHPDVKIGWRKFIC